MRAELAPYALDPFGPSANPSAYVACEASERARAILERSLDAGRVAAVMGPPGHGKTLLLRLIGGREEDRARVAYVPFCTLEFDELCAVVLNAIGVSRPGPPRDALVAVTRELAPRGGVVILVDDAHAMSNACGAGLAALYRELDGALRVALAAVQGVEAQRVFHAFGSAIDVVLLAGGLTGRESRRYVEMRLAYGGARPELLAAFDDATIEALHRASQGVPRRLNQAAEDIVRRATRPELPRLRELTRATRAAPRVEAPAPPVTPAPPPQRAVPPPPAPPAPERRAPERVPVRVAPPTPPVPARAPKREPAPERGAPARPTAPRVPITLVRPPTPRQDEPREEDDGRGILLPEIFDREPGQPEGEYRIVRGEPRAPARDRGVAPASMRRQGGVPGSVLVAPTAGDPPPARRRGELPTTSEYADRVPPHPKPPRMLPIRAIGIAGFVLGVSLSFMWMSSQPYGKAHPLVPKANPRAPMEAAPQHAPPWTEPISPPRAEPAPAPRRKPVAAAPIPELPAAPAPRPRVAVSINAVPWAVVSVDGREIGETPLAGVELEVGRHVFAARMPNGTTREQTIDVKPEHATVVFR